MEKYVYYTGRTPVGGNTSEEDCSRFDTYEEARQWLIEELGDGFACEDLVEYKTAIFHLKNTPEGRRFQFQILHYVWFIIPEKQKAVAVLENVMKAYEELFSRIMTCKHCKETVVGPLVDGLPIFKQDSMLCSFCRKETSMMEMRPYSNIQEFIQFLHEQDRSK